MQTTGGLFGPCFVRRKVCFARSTATAGVLALVVVLGAGGCADSPDYGTDTMDGGNGGGAGGATGGNDAGLPPENHPVPPPAGIVAAGVRWFGRVDVANPAQPRFAWSGTGFAAQFSGTSIEMDVVVSGAAQLFKAIVDGAPRAPVTVASSGTVVLATGLAMGTHTIEVYRQTEGTQGETRLMGVTVPDGTLLDPPPGSERLLEVIGDSITCGYGNLGTVQDSECYTTESHWDTYAAVAARALGAELSTIAASGRGVVRNYGGDTSGTMPMLYTRTLPNSGNSTWDFHVEPQAVIVNLGTNDISNGKGDPGMAFRDTYTQLLATVRAYYPHTFIMCIIGPLLTDADLLTIKGHVRAAVETRNAAGDANVEFFDEILPQSTDKFACQYHPNVAENQLMGEQVTAELAARLGW